MLALFPFFGIFTQIACKSISREGADFISMRQIPLTARSFIKAKRNLSLLVMGISTVVFPALIFAVMLICGKLHWLGCLFGFLICIPNTAVLVNFGIFFDLKEPDIHWVSEKYLTKSSRLYGVFLLLYFIFNIALCVCIAVLSGYFNGIASIAGTGVLLFAVESALAFISSKLMFSYGIKVIKSLTEL